MKLIIKFNEILIFTLQNFDPKKTLFVGNLPYDITEEELRNHFADIGELEGVRVVRDSKFSIGKGFGFVAFQVIILKLNLNTNIYLYLSNLYIFFRQKKIEI